MKEKIQLVLLNIFEDILLGLLSTIIIYCIISFVLPSLLEAFSSKLFNTAQFAYALKSIFSFWKIFIIVFGLRFTVGYISGGYSLK